jgi:2-phospho-L-lactate guanylyltransferase
VIDGAWAVVVARTGPTAKSRLSTVLCPEERAALALAMLADVLAACAGAGLPGTVAVVDTDAGARVVGAAGAHALPDPGAGMNAAVAAGVRFAQARGAGAALVLPGDLPLVRPDDLRAVLAAATATPALVLVPDRAGRGTNALLLRPPHLVAPSFGPDSAARHADASARAGVHAVRLPLARFADVDIPPDLEWARRAGPGDATARALAALSAARP